MRVLARFVLVAAILAAGSWWVSSFYKLGVVRVAAAALGAVGYDIDVIQASLVAPLDVAIWIALVFATPGVPAAARWGAGALGAVTIFVMDGLLLALAVLWTVWQPDGADGMGARVLRSVSAAAPSAACLFLWLVLVSRALNGVGRHGPGRADGARAGH